MSISLFVKPILSETPQQGWQGVKNGQHITVSSKEKEIDF